MDVQRAYAVELRTGGGWKTLKGFFASRQAAEQALEAALAREGAPGGRVTDLLVSSPQPARPRREGARGRAENSRREPVYELKDAHTGVSIVASSAAELREKLRRAVADSPGARFDLLVRGTAQNTPAV